MSDNTTEHDQHSDAAVIAATVAAHWWGNRLRGTAKLDNGNSSEEATATLIAVLAQDAARSASNLSEERIRHFENALAELVRQELVENGSMGTSLSVFYYPDVTLREAADIADIQLSITLLPWETSMEVKLDRITVNGEALPLELPQGQ